MSAPRRAPTGVVVALYLAAAVGANTLVAWGGARWLPVTAFVMIPFDLVTRDRLHERWTGRALWPKMAALVATGALLSALEFRGAWRVAAASCLAFAIAGAVDAAVYHGARSRSRLLRSNLSNVASAAADSVAFPLAAFGALSPAIALTQAGLKALGGLCWAWLLLRERRPAGR